jgi:hypothetical protein
MHGLNLGRIVVRLSAKPSIRVQSGIFVGRFGEEEYALGSTEGGLVQAVRRMRQVRREREMEVA